MRIRLNLIRLEAPFIFVIFLSPDFKCEFHNFGIWQRGEGRGTYSPCVRLSTLYLISSTIYNFLLLILYFQISMLLYAKSDPRSLGIPRLQQK